MEPEDYYIPHRYCLNQVTNDYFDQTEKINNIPPESNDKFQMEIIAEKSAHLEESVGKFHSF